MTTDAAIRAWAKDAGVDCPTRGMVPKGVREQYEAANPPADNPGLSADEPPPAHGYAEAEAAPTRPVAADDVPPVPPPHLLSKLAPKGSTRPRREHKRVSLESVASGLWMLMGRAAQSRGLVPTGRAMTMQAPIAGMILEDTLRGTMVDRLLQPFARGGEAAKDVTALIGMPLLVTVATVRPELQPMVAPALEGILREWAIVAGPRIKAREKREKRAMEQLGVDESGLDELVQTWLMALFAPEPLAPEPGADGA